MRERALWVVELKWPRGWLPTLRVYSCEKNAKNANTHLANFHRGVGMKSRIMKYEPQRKKPMPKTPEQKLQAQIDKLQSRVHDLEITNLELRQCLTHYMPKKAPAPEPMTSLNVVTERDWWNHAKATMKIK